MNILTVLLFSLLNFIVGADSTKSEPIGANLVFVGDAMQHEAQLDQAKLEGGGSRYDYKDCFPLLAPDITEADYAVVNLEVPLGGGPVYRGYPCFSAPDSYAEALRDAGFDLFLTANNHCLDSGDKAARRTLAALDRLGVDHIGTYHDAAQRDSLVPFIKTINGIKIGFLNYTYGTNGIQPKEGMEVAYIDKEKIRNEIEKTRKAGAEMICVTMHWGIEYVLHENKEQQNLSDFLVGEGVDLIIGSHPHVIQPMKVVRNDKENKDVLVVYSLGNLISNMKTTDTRGGALVKVRVEREPDGRPVFKNAAYDIFFAAKPEGRGSNFKVYPSRYADRIPSGQKEHWRMFERNARKIFDECNVKVPAVK
ncbi:MAG: CapA family protein [Muribaculaceae bacterium]|nr:CapA family protein [Muribaculaceae bacterium]